MGMLFRYHNSDDIKTDKGAAKEVAPKAPEKKTSNKSLFTASDIKAMSAAKIRKMANDYNIENPDDLTVGELKSILIDMLVK